MLNPRTTMFVTAGIFAVGALTGCATHPATPASASATPSDYASVQAEAYAKTQADAYASAQAEVDAQAEADADRDQAMADLDTLIDYRNVTSDLRDLLTDAQNYVDDGDVAGLKSLGDNFVRLARRGRDLADIPDASGEANEAWESAMTEYQVAGGALQMGMYSMASKAMRDANDYLDDATDALNSADAES